MCECACLKVRVGVCARVLVRGCVREIINDLIGLIQNTVRNIPHFSDVLLRIGIYDAISLFAKILARGRSGNAVDGRDALTLGSFLHGEPNFGG